MSTPQNTIAIVYDYDQTLSPSYMQDEVVFPTFGIDGKSFWRRCSEFVRARGYDSALADFRGGSHLRLLLEEMVDEIASRIVEQRRAEIATGTVRAPHH